MLLAIGIGALIGAVAGLAVYGVKTAMSKKKKWSWKAAGAHAVGGLVGGGLFPLVLAGFAAVGLPTFAAYTLAGGVAWGGVWSAAQDAASWGFGLEEGMGKPSKYLIATGTGMLATALLFPFAARAVGPGMHLVRHSGTVQAFTRPTGRHLGANLVKSEAEFLAFGAMTETAGAVMNRTVNRAINRAANEVTNNEREPEREPAFELPPEPAPELSGLGPYAAWNPPWEPSPFGSFAGRVYEQRAQTQFEALPPPMPQRTGAVDALEAQIRAAR